MIARKAHLLLCAALVGCRPGADRTQVDDLSRRAEVNRAGERIATHLRSGRAFACGTRSPGDSPDAVFPVTAGQCLSCLEVGGMLRQVARQARKAHSTTWVGVPPGDTAEVCSFLKREKVALPVVLLPSRAYPDPEITSDLLYLRLDSAGALAGVEAAHSGTELLKHVR